jgi:hypothetical protein
LICCFVAHKIQPRTIETSKPNKNHNKTWFFVIILTAFRCDSVVVAEVADFYPNSQAEEAQTVEGQGHAQTQSMVHRLPSLALLVALTLRLELIPFVQG